jgi:feruloyl-CoA synthase
LLADPLSVDGGEITDKGYVNQRAVLARRVADVEDLNREFSGRLIICASIEQYAHHA